MEKFLAMDMSEVAEIATFEEEGSLEQRLSRRLLESYESRTMRRPITKDDHVIVTAAHLNNYTFREYYQDLMVFVIAMRKHHVKGDQEKPTNVFKMRITLQGQYYLHRRTIGYGNDFEQMELFLFGNTIVPEELYT